MWLLPGAERVERVSASQRRTVRRPCEDERRTGASKASKHRRAQPLPDTFATTTTSTTTTTCSCSAFRDVTLKTRGSYYASERVANLEFQITSHSKSDPWTELFLSFSRLHYYPSFSFYSPFTCLQEPSLLLFVFNLSQSLHKAKKNRFLLTYIQTFN